MKQLLGAMAALRLVTGCGTDASTSGPPGDLAEDTRTTAQALAPAVTSGTGAESGGVVGLTKTTGDATLLVAYAATDPTYVTYTTTSQTVKPGASTIGWSYRQPNASSWVRGARLPPPVGWNALWGPASVSLDPNGTTAVLTALAAPASSWPAAGTVTGDMSSYLRGACVAQSTNSGATFVVTHCFTHANHVYDAASIMVAYGGAIYAAYLDRSSSQVDVWYAPNISTPFTLLANPFPAVLVSTPPRLVYDGRYINVMAVDTAGKLWRSTASSTTLGTPVQLATGVAVNTTVTLGNGVTIRQQAPFTSFGYSTGSSGQLYVWYAKRSTSGKVYLQGSICRWSGAYLCTPVPGWSTESMGNTFMPEAEWVHLPDPANPYGEYINKLTFMAEGSSGKVHLVQTTFSMTSYTDGHLDAPTALTTDYTPCPDLRGYWGGRNGLTVHFDNTETPILYRSYTMGGSTCTRNQYNATPQHVWLASFYSK